MLEQHPNIQPSDITELLEKTFDRIYVIHVLGIPHIDERWKNTINEFKRIGLYDCKNLEYVYDVRTPYDNDMFAPLNNRIDNQIYEKLDKIESAQKPGYQIGAKKCTFTHYKLLKQSYILGYQRILIIEDDVVFLKDLYYIYQILKNLPKIDLILMDYFITDNEQIQLLNNIHQNYPNHYEKFIQGEICGMLGTSFYALTSNAMKYIVDLYEKLYLSNKEIPFTHIIQKNDGSNKEFVETYKMNFPNSDHFINNANTNMAFIIAFNNNDVYETHKFIYQYKDTYILPDNIITRGFSLYNICIQSSAIEKTDSEWKPNILYNHIANHINNYNLN